MASTAVSPDPGLSRAIAQAGSQSALGRFIGKNQSTIHDWLKAGKPLPAEYVLQVEAEYGISRHDLRPDLYPIDDAPPSVATLPLRGMIGSGDRRSKLPLGAPVR